MNFCETCHALCIIEGICPNCSSKLNEVVNEKGNTHKLKREDTILEQNSQFENHKEEKKFSVCKVQTEGYNQKIDLKTLSTSESIERRLLKETKQEKFLYCYNTLTKLIDRAPKMKSEEIDSMFMELGRYFVTNFDNNELCEEPLYSMYSSLELLAFFYCPNADENEKKYCGDNISKRMKKVGKKLFRKSKP